MSIRNVLVLAAALCVLPLSSVAAQQATDSARVPVSALTDDDRSYAGLVARTPRAR